MRFKRESLKGLSKLLESMLILLIVIYLFSGTGLSAIVACYLLLTSKYVTLYFWAVCIALLAVLCLALIKGRIRLGKSAKSRDSLRWGRLVRVLLLVWLVLQASLVVYVETEYSAMKGSYMEFFTSRYEEEGALSAAWNVTLIYRQEFAGTYGYRIFVPSRYVQSSYALLFTPILALYCWIGSIGRFVAVQRMGACWEFAVAMATLLRDAAGVHTRVVYFEGMDHTLPEVYLRGRWWVFDASYTTPRCPVTARSYASYLRRERGGLDRYVSRMIVAGIGLDVLREHGFNASTLVVVAIIDPTTNPLDDAPAAHATVEIFALENMYDPLVAVGRTDERGNFSIQLNGGKKYVVVVRHSYGGRPMIGIAEVYLPPNACTVIEVRLYKRA